MKQLVASGVEERSYVHRRSEDFGGHGGGVSDVVKVSVFYRLDVPEDG